MRAPQGRFRITLLWRRLRLISLRQLYLFTRYLFRRYDQDRCLQMAAGLSYSSLLALVPLLAIALGLLAAFPAFDEARESLREMLFQAIPPDQAARANEHLDSFLRNAAKLTAPGIVGLAVTALLLLSNINTSINTIWRVRQERPLVLRLLVYWALLTLGPLLLGASLSITSYAFATVHAAGSLEAFSMPLTRMLAILLATLGCAVFFIVVPNRPVSLPAGLAGGFLAAVLLEILKYGFGLYVGQVPSYQAVYGALSALPIFLIWMYLAWAVILLGAQLAAALPEWRAVIQHGHLQEAPLNRLVLALALLERLRSAHGRGRPLTERMLAAGLPATPVESGEVVDRLRESGLIISTSGGRQVLGRDLSQVTLGQLVDYLDLTPKNQEDWPALVQDALAGLYRELENPLSQSLDSLLAGRQTYDKKEESASAEQQPSSLRSLRSGE
ncbi:YihY family inner membrane protein [Fodinicurvata halophila]|uniref:UPF0761 membrane protein ACFOW6_15500 n=1 Tax=Fodinicurvata halophila TaxID=1419723 RepID=A0ABV8UNV3_9PROT